MFDERRVLDGHDRVGGVRHNAAGVYSIAFARAERQTRRLGARCDAAAHAILADAVGRCNDNFL